LQRNLDHLDWLIPQWVHIQDPDANGNPIVTEIDPPALDLIRETRPQNSYPADGAELDRREMGSGTPGSRGRQRRVASASHQSPHTFVEQNKFGGVCIDFEEPPPSSQPTCSFHATASLQLFSSAAGWWQSSSIDSEEWNYRELRSRQRLFDVDGLRRTLVD